MTVHHPSLRRPYHRRRRRVGGFRAGAPGPDSPPAARTAGDPPTAADRSSLRRTLGPAVPASGPSTGTRRTRSRPPPRASKRWAAADTDSAMVIDGLRM